MSFYYFRGVRDRREEITEPAAEGFDISIRSRVAADCYLYGIIWVSGSIQHIVYQRRRNEEFGLCPELDKTEMVLMLYRHTHPCNMEKMHCVQVVILYSLQRPTLDLGNGMLNRALTETTLCPLKHKSCASLCTVLGPSVETH